MVAHPGDDWLERVLLEDRVGPPNRLDKLFYRDGGVDPKDRVAEWEVVDDAILCEFCAYSTEK